MKKTFDFFRECIDLHEWKTLRKNLLHMHPFDIANLIESLSPEHSLIVFRMLSKDIASEVFANLSHEKALELINMISDEELSKVLSELMVDDAVDMLEEMPASVVKRVLANSEDRDRRLINQFLCYKDGSAGAIMTAEYISLKKEMTVIDALNIIRKDGPASETIYTCYVVDSTRRLQGILSVKDLLLARDSELVGDLMNPDCISVSTETDQEESAMLISKYDLLALPVTDKENRLVGIITVDDILDVVVEENTEDIEKMAALAPSDKPYLKTGVLNLARNRIGWLMVLMISGMVTGTILSSYESALLALPILTTFIPMLTDSGGNAGSQSSTLVIRGMAVGEIAISDWFRVLWKELRVSLIVGGILSSVNFARIWIIDKNPMLAIAVSIALYTTLIMAKTIGCILPLVAKSLKLDPAIMAAPLITTIVDALSLIIYFACAKMILGL